MKEISKKNDKKIAVLVVISLKGGGAEQSVLTLGQGFHALGYETHIVTFKDRVEYELLPELHYHHFKTKRFNVFPKSVRYRVMSAFLDRFILKRIGIPNIVLSNLDTPDKVLAHSRLDNVAFVIRNNIAAKYGFSVASPDHNNPHFQWINRVYRKKPCVCLSHGLEKNMRTLLEAPLSGRLSGHSPIITTIANPFDKTRILRMANAALPHDLPHTIKALVDSGQFLIHLGFFKPQKAHDILLNAYAQSSQQLPLLLVGNGQLLGAMKELASDLGIADKVHFLGFYKNPYPFVKKAKAMVLSSHYEGFVRVVVEALVVGTPVISCDCPFGPGEVLPEKNLVPVADIGKLAEKMTDCMDDPVAYLVEFDERLLPQNIAKQYQDFFCSIKASATSNIIAKNE